MRKFMGVVMLIGSLVVFGIRVYDGVIISQNVTGHLKNAADANTVELAEQELTIALNYLESNGLTEGYTSILYETPKDDITFWYRNLKASQEELRTLSSSSSLERTNWRLMRPMFLFRMKVQPSPLTGHRRLISFR